MTYIDDIAKCDVIEIKRRLEKLHNEVNEVVVFFDLDGKKLEVLNRDHPQHLMCYGLLLQEAKVIEEFVKGKLESIEAIIYKETIENSQRALTATDIKMWIKSDSRYTEYNQLLVDSGYVKNMLQSIIDALQTMGWSLSNIVKLRIAAIEDITL